LKLLEGLVEGPFVGGLIAQIESELLCREDVLVFEDAGVLEAESAHAEPFMVGHPLDESAFGFGLGLVFCCEAGAEFAEFLGIFVIEQVERLTVVLAETVRDAVLGRRLLASEVGPEERWAFDSLARICAAERVSRLSALGIFMVG